MDVKDLSELVLKVSSGKDDLANAAVGFNGYGFVFQDIKHSDSSYVVTAQSSKVCGAGAYRDIMQKALHLDEINSLNELVRYEEKYDLFFAGALKTILPTLEFGGDEVLFSVWVFVKTPNGKQFPAKFYFGPSGTSLGGWHSEDYVKVFPKSFTQIINASPFDFSNDEKEELIEALELALKKIPVSDFYGVYQHDGGNALMGVKVGVPFIVELGYKYDDLDIECYLEYKGQTAKKL